MANGSSRVGWVIGGSAKISIDWAKDYSIDDMYVYGILYFWMAS